MIKMSKYLDFTEATVPKGYKTKRIIVYNKKSYMLGMIRWKGEWRKYCFFPRIDSVFDSKCLLEIVEFIKKLMDERK